MAEIEIERRPQRSGWKWLVLVLLLLAVAVGAWLVFYDGGLPGVDARPATEETTEAPAPMTEPARPLERPPESRPLESTGGPEEESGEGEPQPRSEP